MKNPTTFEGNTRHAFWRREFNLPRINLRDVTDEYLAQVEEVLRTIQTLIAEQQAELQSVQAVLTEDDGFSPDDRAVLQQDIIELEEGLAWARVVQTQAEVYRNKVERWLQRPKGTLEPDEDYTDAVQSPIEFFPPGSGFQQQTAATNSEPYDSERPDSLRVTWAREVFDELGYEIPANKFIRSAPRTHSQKPYYKYELPTGWTVYVCNAYGNVTFIVPTVTSEAWETEHKVDDLRAAAEEFEKYGVVYLIMQTDREEWKALLRSSCVRLENIDLTDYAEPLALPSPDSQPVQDDGVKSNGIESKTDQKSHALIAEKTGEWAGFAAVETNGEPRHIGTENACVQRVAEAYESEFAAVGISKPVRVIRSLWKEEKTSAQYSGKFIDAAGRLGTGYVYEELVTDRFRVKLKARLEEYRKAVRAETEGKWAGFAAVEINGEPRHIGTQNACIQRAAEAYESDFAAIGIPVPIHFIRFLWKKEKASAEYSGKFIDAAGGLGTGYVYEELVTDGFRAKLKARLEEYRKAVRAETEGKWAGFAAVEINGEPRHIGTQNACAQRVAEAYESEFAAVGISDPLSIIRSLWKEEISATFGKKISDAGGNLRTGYVYEELVTDGFRAKLKARLEEYREAVRAETKGKWAGFAVVEINGKPQHIGTENTCVQRVAEAYESEFAAVGISGPAQVIRSLWKQEKTSAQYSKRVVDIVGALRTGYVYEELVTDGFKEKLEAKLKAYREAVRVDTEGKWAGFAHAEIDGEPRHIGTENACMQRVVEAYESEFTAARISRPAQVIGYLWKQEKTSAQYSKRVVDLHGSLRTGYVYEELVTDGFKEKLEAKLEAYREAVRAETEGDWAGFAAVEIEGETCHVGTEQTCAQRVAQEYDLQFTAVEIVAPIDVIRSLWKQEKTSMEYSKKVVDVSGSLRTAYVFEFLVTDQFRHRLLGYFQQKMEKSTKDRR